MKTDSEKKPDREVFRNSATKLIMYLVFAFTMLVVGISEIRSKPGSQSVGYFIISIIFMLVIWLLMELFQRPEEIILTSYGIELRDTGFFNWEIITAFSIIDHKFAENSYEELVLHFHEYSDHKTDITLLVLNLQEFAESMLEWKGEHNIIFKGIETR